MISSLLIIIYNLIYFFFQENRLEVFCLFPYSYCNNYNNKHIVLMSQYETLILKAYMSVNK